MRCAQAVDDLMCKLACNKGSCITAAEALNVRVSCCVAVRLASTSARADTKTHVADRAAVTSREDVSLTNLNIMIAIAGGYFGQDEELATVFEA